MRLFPESEEFICTRLINPISKEVDLKYIDLINRVVIRLSSSRKSLNDYQFDVFVDLLNGALSENQDNNEEIRLFKRDFFTDSLNYFTGVPYINDWDLCCILLVIKKMIDEKLTACDNPCEFIENTILALTPIVCKEDEDFSLISTYFPKNFTYSNIEDDKFMNDFFDYFYEHLYDDDPEINIIDLLGYPNNSGYPTFLLLNKNFRQKVYEAIDENEFYQLIEKRKSDINFVKTLIKYQPLALRFIGDDWRNNREIVTLAVSTNGLALEYAPHEFKSDIEIVLLSVKNNAKSLVFASDEIILAASISFINGIKFTKQLKKMNLTN